MLYILSHDDYNTLKKKGRKGNKAINKIKDFHYCFF